jgi:hypothetical protein
MKKSSLNRATKAETQRIINAVRIGLAAWVALICALSPKPAFADADPNQLLAFKKIYIEQIQDNVDGAFREPVEQTFHEVFDRNPRFELVKDQGSADTLLRTLIKKQTNSTEVEISLVTTGSGEIFTTEHTAVPSTSTGVEMGATIKALLKAALKRIPFYGTVTGRDGDQLTFDIGAAHGLKKGDVIQIARIDNIKRHPLLKSIVDVQLVPVGSAAVDEVEETIAFGHVSNEITGEKIQKYHKITAIEARAVEAQPLRPIYDEATIAARREQQAKEVDRPELGNVSLSILLGTFSGTSTLAATTSTFSGSAFCPGIKGSAELWLTKHWFVDTELGLTSMSYVQSDTSLTQPDTTPGTVSAARILGFNAGYKYLADGSLYGPQAFLKLGYYSFVWHIADNPSIQQSAKSYSGLNLGVGGSVPIGSINSGLQVSANVLLFPSLTEESLKTGTPTSVTGANFYLGGYYYFTPKIAARAGLRFDTYSAEMDNGAATTSQKMFSFMPSILYYF